MLTGTFAVPRPEIESVIDSFVKRLKQWVKSSGKQMNSHDMIHVTERAQNQISS